MAIWDAKIWMVSAAVQGETVFPPEQQMLDAIDTGMVLHGYPAAFRVTDWPYLSTPGGMRQIFCFGYRR
ncbi:MAG: hypothetical protein ACREO5_09735 [Candidatus Binatia bacterium]